MSDQMEVLRNLYKAQIKMAEAYEMCSDKNIKEQLGIDYAQLEITITNLENRLEIFKED